MDEKNRAIYLKKYNVTILNTNCILDNAANTASTELYNTFGETGDRSSKLWQKLFYNEYITNICQLILEQQSRVVLYYQDMKNSDYDAILKKLSRYLPIPLVQNGVLFSNIPNCVESKSAAITSKLEIAASKSEAPTKKYCLQNFKNFLQNNDLEFLHSTYFKEIKNKLILSH